MGRFAVLRDKDIPICIHCNSALIRFKDLYPKTFCFALIQSDIFQNLLKSKKGSSVQDFLSLSKISELDIPSFTKDEIEFYERKYKSLLNKITIHFDEIAPLKQLSKLLISQIAQQ